VQHKPQSIKVIVDTNIVFSALLSPKGKIADIIFDSANSFAFYSCSYMRLEINEHWNKLRKISKLTDDELDEARSLLFSRIQFLNEELIPEKTWIFAEKLTADIDVDDLVFGALTRHLDGLLWSGDKRLLKGLSRKGFENTITTNELYSLLETKDE